VNTDFKDAYASHFAAMKKVLAPKIIYRVVTASEQWGKGNLGNKSAAEKARLAFEEKEAKLIQWVEKDAAAVQKAAATRREYARVAPWCVRLLMQQGGTSVDDVCEALKDDEVKALLHHMGELTFAPGKAIERCKQLADLVSRVDLPPLASLPPLTDSEIKALGRKKAASDKKKAKAAKTKTTEATSQQVPPPPSPSSTVRSMGPASAAVVVSSRSSSPVPTGVMDPKHAQSPNREIPRAKRNRGGWGRDKSSS
jgi:hypothetical protein